MIPDVVHPAGDQFVQPRLGKQFVHVCLANAGGHTGQQPRLNTVIEAAQCAAEHVLAPAALVAGDLTSLDADERCDVAYTPQLSGHFLRDHLTVGEDLEIAVRMSPKKIEQLRMEKRFTAQHAEEAVTVFFRVPDELAQIIDIDHLARRLDIDPAALAAQVATVDDREIEKRREILAALKPAFEALDREHSLHPEVPDELPEQTLVGGAQNACTQPEHRAHQLTAACALAAASSARR